MFKILKKVRKDIRELKTNQTVLIDKMEGMEREWKEFKKSFKPQ